MGSSGYNDPAALYTHPCVRFCCLHHGFSFADWHASRQKAVVWSAGRLCGLVPVEYGVG